MALRANRHTTVQISIRIAYIMIPFFRFAFMCFPSSLMVS